MDIFSFYLISVHLVVLHWPCPTLSETTMSHILNNFALFMITVKHYKRKTERGPDPNNLKAALELVKRWQSTQKAANSCYVNFVTLSRAIRKKDSDPSGYSSHTMVTFIHKSVCLLKIWDSRFHFTHQKLKICFNHDFLIQRSLILFSLA